jgi:choline monooxygenase
MLDLPAVDPDIRRARTPPPELYIRPDLYARIVDRVLAASWQLLLDVDARSAQHGAAPAELLPGSIGEPLLVATDLDGRRRCLSNVCTHRGAVLLADPTAARGIRCTYHGRRFGLDGRCEHMPAFEGVEGFPAPEDDLREYPLERWGPLAWTSLAPAAGFDEVVGAVRDRLQGPAPDPQWLPMEALRVDPEGAREYEFDASWLLYVENYLEGFHIPYVHPGLAPAVDFATYATALLPCASVQIAEAAAGDPSLGPPVGHAEHGRRIAAYYVFVFPNTMLNFYPWGVSVNVVLPLGLARSRVAFRRYLWRPDLLERGAGADLHRVELEDEAVVRRVQRGMASRAYRGGRYSPSRETGVHHFHRLLLAALA